jgi:autotransporter strand-loop-strand O-heptosyltransferase
MTVKKHDPFARPTECPTQDGTFCNTQDGVPGIYFDYNLGLRIWVTVGGCTTTPILRIIDAHTGTKLSDGPMEIPEGDSYFKAITKRRFFMAATFEIEIDGKVIFKHDYDPSGKEVIIMLPKGSVGDTIAWFPACMEWLAQYPDCHLTVQMAEALIPLFDFDGSKISFVHHDDDLPLEEAYATYYVGLFIEDTERVHNPIDYKLTSLVDIARIILGLQSGKEVRPFIACSWGCSKRPISEPYVCIAAQSTAGAKMWLNPYGWGPLVAQLKKDGFRVICIDRDVASGDRIFWHFMPIGVEDETGNRPFSERVNWIRHCEFFIGLSSGLSWLSWALHKPTVLISGFTHPNTEFYTPYRVFNPLACNSCWNRHLFDNQDFLWCPDHADTPKHFECSNSISAHHVMRLIKTIPAYKRHMELQHAATQPVDTGSYPEG